MTEEATQRRQPKKKRRGAHEIKILVKVLRKFLIVDKKLYKTAVCI